MLNELGLGLWWQKSRIDEEQWKVIVKKSIHKREEEQWKEEIVQRPKLRTYVKLKEKLEMEKYLKSRDRYGVPEITKFRGWTNRLRIEKGRYEKIPAELRICEFCERGEVEDEALLLDCTRYDELRKTMWKEHMWATSRIPEFRNREEKLNAVIGSGLNDQQVATAVLKFVRKSMKVRRALEGAGPAVGVIHLGGAQ